LGQGQKPQSASGEAGSRGGLGTLTLPQSRLSYRHSAFFALLLAFRGRISHLRYFAKI
jgi:hypothetical protein